MDSFTRGVLRALIWLYPPSFRESVGRDLTRLLLDRAREESARGWPNTLRFVVSSVALAVRDASLEWAETWTSRSAGWGGGTMRDLVRSWRLTARGLARRPGYSIPVIATLALGIGANAAMFAVLESVVLADLPYPESERLVEVHAAAPSGDRVSFSLPDLRDWAERTGSLEALGAWSTLPSDVVYTGGRDALELETAWITAGFFGALAAEPMLGRFPTEAEDLASARVVVVSRGFWERHLGADPAAVGRSIPLNDEPYTVVGVMPATFDFPTPEVDAWTFLSVIPASSIPLHIREVRFLDAVGRLRADVSLEAARDELSALAAGLSDEYPDSNEDVRSATLTPLRDALVGDSRLGIVVLMGASLLILGIAIANLANLALARESRRTGDLALRAALGASSARRMGLVLGESLTLALVGGGLGLAAAFAGTPLLARWSAGILPRAHEIDAGGGAALFALALSVVVGAAFALLPGLRAGTDTLGTRIRRTGRGAAGGGMRAGLVVSQVTLALVLLVGSMMLIRSVAALSRTDPGFEAAGLAVAELTFASSRYPERADYLARFDATRNALASLPRVRSVGSVRRFPFLGGPESVRWRLPEDGDVEGDPAGMMQVGHGSFETLGASLVKGSDFEREEEPRPVAIVNRTLARAAFGDGPALGRSLVASGLQLEIVGVVEDIRHEDLRGEPEPMVYVPNRLIPRRGAAFLVRAEPGAEDRLLTGIRDAIREADPGQPITTLTWASDVMAGQLSRPRLVTALLGLFAFLAAALAGVGVYGVVAFGVTQRRRELGIRLAMGAEAPRLRRSLAAQGMRPVVIGLVLGAGLAVLAAGGIQSLVFGIDRFDPVSLLVAAAGLGALGALGCWIPAGRVLATAPQEALRSE